MIPPGIYRNEMTGEWINVGTQGEVTRGIGSSACSIEAQDDDVLMLEVGTEKAERLTYQWRDLQQTQQAQQP